VIAIFNVQWVCAADIQSLTEMAPF